MGSVHVQRRGLEQVDTRGAQWLREFLEFCKVFKKRRKSNLEILRVLRVVEIEVFRVSEGGSKFLCCSLLLVDPLAVPLCTCPEEEAEFLGSYLGPTLKGKYPDLHIFAWDYNKDLVYKWAQTMHAHPTASKYLDGIAVHWYTGDHFDNLAKVNKDFPQFKPLPTEATNKWDRRRTLADENWEGGLAYAHDIIGDLNSGAVGWTDWNMLLDEGGGPNHLNNWDDAPLRYNRSAKEMVIHPQYWFLAHFTRYLPPGSRLSGLP